jgi:hypothetical protein
MNFLSAQISTGGETSTSNEKKSVAKDLPRLQVLNLSKKLVVDSIYSNQVG